MNKFKDDNSKLMKSHDIKAKRKAEKEEKEGLTAEARLEASKKRLASK